jgi:hypothetical protein
MEQERQKLNISLKPNGELTLSGSVENLSQEEFILLQQVIDESQRRSKTAERIEERMKEGQAIVGICGAIAIIFLTFLGCYTLISCLSSQLTQINQNYDQ